LTNKKLNKRKLLPQPLRWWVGFLPCSFTQRIWEFECLMDVAIRFYSRVILDFFLEQSYSWFMLIWVGRLVELPLQILCFLHDLRCRNVGHAIEWKIQYMFVLKCITLCKYVALIFFFQIDPSEMSLCRSAIFWSSRRP